MDLKKQTITIPEAGRILGVSRNSAYEAAKRGQIPVIQLGWKKVVPIPAFERMLQTLERQRAQ